MIESARYIKFVRECFNFLIVEYEFKVLEEEARGSLFYDVRFGHKTKVISVSYENIEDYLLVKVYLLENGNLPSYDDNSRILYLAALNKAILPSITQEAFRQNKNYFSQIKADNLLEKKILKSAEELRLCMRKLNL